MIKFEATLSERPVIDAHMHLWDRAVSGYPWLSPALGPLYADFGPEDARSQLSVAGINSAVLVQADDSRADTQYMLDVAASHPWVVGVVGWVPLNEPATAEVLLEEWSRHSVLRGLRSLMRARPQDRQFHDLSTLQTLSLIADAGMAFEVPYAWPQHLATLEGIADRFPTLTFVIDHLGTPPTDPQALGRWTSLLRDVAARPNVVVKVSGLHQFPRPLFERIWDTALEMFGPSRLMYGSDWPMSIPLGGYGDTWQRILDLLHGLSASERAEILCGTASRTYRLDLERPSR